MKIKMFLSDDEKRQIEERREKNRIDAETEASVLSMERALAAALKCEIAEDRTHSLLRIDYYPYKEYPALTLRKTLRRLIREELRALLKV